MFEGISCNHCNLHFSGVPSWGLIDENGEPAIFMFPDGSRPLDPKIRTRLPSDFFSNSETSWSLDDYLCIDCKSISTLLSDENINCLKCGSSNVKSSFELEGKICPVCGIGRIEKDPPSGICY